MTWCHHYPVTLRARHILGCLNVMANLLSWSNQVQSTEWSLHPQMFKQICQKWFNPLVDLIATYLNHKFLLYVSPVPEQHAWDIDALNINWSGLTAYASSLPCGRESLKKVPPCLPAVLQLRGYGQNFQLEEGGSRSISLWGSPSVLKGLDQCYTSIFLGHWSDACGLPR